MNRDPIAEKGANLGQYRTFDGGSERMLSYTFVKNSPQNLVDPFGLASVATPAGQCALIEALGPVEAAEYLGISVARATALIGATCGSIPKRKCKCSPKRLRNLQRAVGNACKTNKRSCVGVTDCQTARKRLKRNIACVLARRRISNECYGGADPGHKKAAELAWDAAKVCLEKISELCH